MVKVAIIGGGLAGTACAYMLRQAGVEPVIYEAGESLASGASGNDLGMYNPRFSAERTPEAEYHMAAFDLALEVFPSLCHSEQNEESGAIMQGVSSAYGVRNDGNNIDWEQCGALHLITDEKKAKRFPQTVENWGWGERLRIVGAKEASAIAGIELEYDALYVPESGYVSPKKLCHALAENVEVKLGQRIENVADIDADVVILANSLSAKTFEPELPVKPVRGQVTQVRATESSKALKCNVHYGGYMSKAHGGVHMVGATFQRWLDHTDLLDEDDEHNISKIAEFVPSLGSGYEIVNHRASLRCASKDHFPIVGELSDGLCVSIAHGSHGIISSLMAARILTDMITEQPSRLNEDVLQALSPQRFL